ncbi:MAG: hypothetical protein IKN55_06850 [Oscillospiraceae bacterium]|nr:hypothetical protein [Oscillospiraceae bacterium]
MHRNSLLGASQAASFLYNLTKNLTAHLHHQLCAVLPKMKCDNIFGNPTQRTPVQATGPGVCVFSEFRYSAR